jgi:hypothetical protein
MSNEMTEWNDETKRTVNVMDYTNGSVAKQSTSTSSAAMACKRKKRIFFSFYFMGFFLLFSSSSSSSSSSRTITKVTHYMTVNSKTHKNAQPRC